MASVMTKIAMISNAHRQILSSLLPKEKAACTPACVMSLAKSATFDTPDCTALTEAFLMSFNINKINKASTIATTGMPATLLIPMILKMLSRTNRTIRLAM